MNVVEEVGRLPTESGSDISSRYRSVRRSYLHMYAKFTAGCTFLLLIAGGLVTSTDSGLAVPDWPLSYGQYFPKMVGGVLFEHGHRMIAGAVGILTLVLAGWIHLRESRLWVRHLAKAAAGGILLQAGLGGITVLYLLPPAVSVAHACLGQAVFCAVLVLAQATSPWYRSRVEGSAGGFWKLAFLAVGAVTLQLFLGAVLRHSGTGLVLHLLGALAATGAILWAAYRTKTRFDRAPQALKRPASLLLMLLPVQILLGILAYLTTLKSAQPPGFWSASLPTAHVAVGALILGTSVVWTLRAYKLK